MNSAEPGEHTDSPLFRDFRNSPCSCSFDGQVRSCISPCREMKGEMPIALEHFLRVAVETPAHLASLFPVDEPGKQAVELPMQAAPVD